MSEEVVEKHTGTYFFCWSYFIVSKACRMEAKNTLKALCIEFCGRFAAHSRNKWWINI